MPGFTDYTNILIGLLAILNVIGAIPVYLGLTDGQSREDKHKVAYVAAVAVAVILLVALIAGSAILKLFGIDVNSFRVAGGILILLMGLGMIRGRGDEHGHGNGAAGAQQVAIVPLAMPVMAGPGAISAVIVFASKHSSTDYMLISGSVILVCAFIAWLCMRAGPWIADKLGPMGMNVMTKVMGLILAAMGVSFMAHGLTELFPVLGNAAVAG